MTAVHRNVSGTPNDEPVTEEGIEGYLDAMTEADPMDLAAPATALADLLAARLEHRSDPEARAVLESFIRAAGEPPPEEP